MKTIGRFLFDIIVCIWAVVAIFVTVCLLSYNEFKVTTLGKNSLLIVDSDELEPEFIEGDLLIVKRNSDSKINAGDRVFYYNSLMDTNTLIFQGEVNSKNEITKTETTYVIDGSNVSGEYVIGKVEEAKVYHNVGTFLGVFTSKWGFMFLVIFPTLFAIIYEIMMIADTTRSSKRRES